MQKYVCVVIFRLNPLEYSKILTNKKQGGSIIQDDQRRNDRNKRRWIDRNQR